MYIVVRVTIIIDMLIYLILQSPYYIGGVITFRLYCYLMSKV